MAADFDPYRKWLGIQPGAPINHYRLLGIALFESDPEVISNAADRQMVHVRTYQGGQHSQWSQKILNKLSTARVCLLSPEKKTQYDVGLRREISARRPPAVLLPRPLAPLADPVPPSSSQTPQTTGPSDGVEPSVLSGNRRSRIFPRTASSPRARPMVWTRSNCPSRRNRPRSRKRRSSIPSPSPIAAEGDATEDLGAFSPPLVSGRTVTRRRRRNRTPGVWISVIAVIAVILLLLIAWALNSPAPDVGGPSKRPAQARTGILGLLPRRESRP